MGAGVSRKDQVIGCIVMLCQLADRAQLGSLQALDELMRNMCSTGSGEQQQGGARRLPQDLVVELLRWAGGGRGGRCTGCGLHT